MRKVNHDAEKTAVQRTVTFLYYSFSLTVLKILFLFVAFESLTIISIGVDMVYLNVNHDFLILA